MDLPVWQVLYTELSPRNFVIIPIAMDTGGAADAAPWIEPAPPTPPSLIDVHHRVAELYYWVNVPSIAWSDEESNIARPNDPGLRGEYFRGMMEPDFDFQAMMAEYRRQQERYLAAVRDWVERGPACSYALTPQQVRARLAGPNPDHARASA